MAQEHLRLMWRLFKINNYGKWTFWDMQPTIQWEAKQKDGPRMKFEVKKDEEEWIPLDVAAGSSSNSVVQIAEK